MKVWGGSIVALVCLAAYLFWPDSRSYAPSAGSEGRGTEGISDGSSELIDIKIMPIAEQSLRINLAETGTKEDVAILELLLTHYRRAFQTNPVGLNHDIVRALAGGNAKRAAFLSPQHPAISDSGELLDRWGKPFFFHQISGTKMEVLSAGPDREMWTEDDVKSE